MPLRWRRSSLCNCFVDLACSFLEPESQMLLPAFLLFIAPGKDMIWESDLIFDAPWSVWEGSTERVVACILRFTAYSCRLSSFYTWKMLVQNKSLSHQLYTPARLLENNNTRLVSSRGVKQQLILTRRAFRPARQIAQSKKSALPENGRQYGRAAEVSTALWLLSQLPANAAESSVDFSKGSFSTQSYIVTLGLFLISLPGEQSGFTWSPLLYGVDPRAFHRSKFEMCPSHIAKVTKHEGHPSKLALSSIWPLSYLAAC